MSNESTPDPQAKIIRVWLIVGVLSLMTLAVLMAFWSLSDAIGIWLVYQWEPIFRAVFALGVVALCVYILMRLTRRAPEA